MTALTSNDITVSHNNTTSPLNVALVGVTLIQQMLLEFYFATPEGVQKYTLVLANDAEAYITNFDEENAAEAWQNLHRDENKPTLVLSDHNEIKGHYLYLMTPLTPQGLFEAGCTLKQFSIRSSDKDQLIPASTPLFAEKNSTKGSNLEQVEFISLPDEVVVDSLKSMTEDVLNPNNVVNDVSDDLISFDDLIDSSSSTPPFEDELDYQSIEDMALEEIRVAEKDKSAEKSRLAEAVRLAEEARQAEAVRLAEEARQADEARLAEEARQADEARLAEEARQADEARLAEEIRKAKEADARVEAEALAAAEIKAIKDAAAQKVADELAFNSLSLGGETDPNAFDGLDNLDDLLGDLSFDDQLFEGVDDNNLSADIPHFEDNMEKLQEVDDFGLLDELSLDAFDNNMLPQTAKDDLSIASLDELSDALIDDEPISLTVEETVSSEEAESEISSSDDLQQFLDELGDKQSRKELEKASNIKVSDAAEEKKREEHRWGLLCGEAEDSLYDKKGTLPAFDLSGTLIPYIKDTIAFTERADYWMEVAYNPLSIIIDPEAKLIRCNLSIDDPLFIQMCRGKIHDELVELLEVNEQHIEDLRNESSHVTQFCYSFKAFLWSVSLLSSHGELAADVNPNEKIRINDWLTLKEVERFPYIWQIAAVFNQHHASLNQAASWLNLPKRYVYAFYNGVSTLEMVVKTSKETEEGIREVKGKEKTEGGFMKLFGH